MSNAAFLAFIKKHPVGVICGAVSLALVVTIYLRSDLISAAEEELVQRTAEGERYSANIKNAAQLKDQLDALVAANKEAETRIIFANQASLGTNSQIFYKLESETGIKLLDFRPSPAVPRGKNFVSVGFSLTMQGELTQLLKVLRQLESGAHYCRILSASCNLSGASRQGPLTMSLSLEILGLP